MKNVHLVGCATTLESVPPRRWTARDTRPISQWHAGARHSTTAGNPRNHAGGDEDWDF